MQTLSLPILSEIARNPYIALPVLALSTWRLTSMLVYEEGPWDIFVRFRSWVGVYYDQLSNRQGRNVVARALNCVWCTSPYVGTVFLALWIVFPLIIWIVMPLALSAAAIMVEISVGRD